MKRNWPALVGCLFITAGLWFLAKGVPMLAGLDGYRRLEPRVPEAGLSNRPVVVKDPNGVPVEITARTYRAVSAVDPYWYVAPDGSFDLGHIQLGKTEIFRGAFFLMASMVFFGQWQRTRLRPAAPPNAR